MVEDHAALANGHIDEGQYLEQCTLVLRERERMLHFELDRLREGLLFCLFDTPDRVQHMFWRFASRITPPTVGAQRISGRRHRGSLPPVRRHRGRALARADDRTMLMVLSDHGFNSFQRGVH
jgi:hypothetical protein